MLKSLLRVTLALGCAHAAEPDRTVEEWAAELGAAFAQNSGFTATYASSEEAKPFTATLGFDRDSGVSVFHFVGEKDGRAVVLKQWSPGPDDLYTQAGDAFMHVGNLRAMIEEELGRVAEIFADGDDSAAPDLSADIVPSFLLTATHVDAALGISNRRELPWKRVLAGAEVRESDEVSVTFRTVAHGTVTLSRGDGLLLRQRFAAGADDQRGLDLTHSVIDPGAEAVRDIIKDWGTEGARPMDIMPFRKSVRFKVLQAVIDSLERDEVTPEELSERMARNDEALARFVTGIPVPQQMGVDQLMDKVLGDFEKMLLEAVEKRGAGEREFRQLVALEKLRKGFRDRTIALAQKDAMLRKAVGGALVDLPALRVRTPESEAFLEVLESALAEAYFATAADRAMERRWGPPGP